MTKNWEKIFKDKPGGDLYKICNGQTKLSDEAIKYAKKELINRNVDFNNIDRHKKKWELEKLIKESEENSFFFGSIASSKHFLLMAVTGAIIATITIFDVFLEYPIQTSFKEEYRLDEILLFVFSLAFMIYGIIMHKKEKKREQIRNKRIKEIIEEL